MNHLNLCARQKHTPYRAGEGKKVWQNSHTQYTDEWIGWAKRNEEKQELLVMQNMNTLQFIDKQSDIHNFLSSLVESQDDGVDVIRNERQIGLVSVVVVVVGVAVIILFCLFVEPWENTAVCSLVNVSYRFDGFYCLFRFVSHLPNAIAQNIER